MTDQLKPAAPQERTLLTVTQVAAFLNVSPAYIYELAKRRQIPCGRIGRLVRFERDEVERWWKLRKRG